jgi:carboxyl-terminal processing protease
MALRFSRWALLLLLILVPTQSWAADETLASAYADILRGDWETGRTVVDRLADHGDPNAVRVHDWLTSYHDIVASRKDLKARTFDWNLEHAKTALAADQLYLTLSFASQAAAYAADPNEFAGSPWVTALFDQAKAAARELEAQDRWIGALSYYMLLGRIRPDDDDIKSQTERVGHYARVQLTYKNAEALREHIRDVDKSLFRTAVRRIQQMYFKEPDFKQISQEGLDQLLTLCRVQKLQKFLDGLGNPALREHFVRRITELRTEVAAEKEFTDKDLLRLFNRVLDLNRESLELPEGLVIVEFVEGLISGLDDYTGMVWPSDATDFDKAMMGGFEGVGIQLGVDERSNRLKVVTPLENSPALEAGLQPDDVIVSVNGESTAGWTSDDAVRKITGPAGTDVVLSVLRPTTGQEMAFKLTRRKIVISSVHGAERTPGDAKTWNYLLDKEAGVAYIRLSNFHPDSARELADALEQAEKQGMKGLILDVRHNPGGLLDVVVDIVSLFVDEGEVVSTRGRQESERRTCTAAKARFKDIPLVVLVNEHSASASEILAGALQDHHRALVLGERTFGKGSVQHVQPLSEKARIKLTTALYYLPSGRTPHKLPHADRWGVDPDWELKLTPKEFRRVVEHEREAYIIHNEKRESGSNKELSADERAKIVEELKGEPDDKEAEPPLLSESDIKQLESDPNEAPKADPQLQTALLLVRVKLAAGMPWPREFVAAARAE